MANLSNINNILRTGSLGVGINRDPLGAFEISSATKPGIKMFNTAASGKTYEAYSDTNGNYIIYDQDADDNRFVINSAGNATFTGNITLGDSHFIGDDTFDNLLLQSSSGENLILSAANDLIFYTGGTAPNALGTQRLRIFNSNGSATFAGQVNVGINLLMNNNKEIRWLDSGGAERTVLEVDSNDDLYLGKSGGGNLYLVNGTSYTTAVTIDSSQNATFAGTVTAAGYSGPGQGLDNLLPLGVYSTTPGTAGVLIKTNIVSNNYGFIFGTINLEQFNFPSVQRIQLSATVASNGTVVTKAATSDIAITMKLFHTGGYWYIHLPMPSTYVTVSAYIYTGAGYQGQAKGFNEVNTITVNPVPSGATSSVDIVADVYLTTGTSSPWLKNANDIYNSNSGKVGIGTDSPAQILHLNNSATLTATYQKFTNGTATTGTTLGIDADGDFLINNGENKEIKLYTNDSQRLTIQSGGNVGIGVTSPSAKLHVKNRSDELDMIVRLEATRDAYLQFSPANTTKWALIADYPATGDFTTYNYPNSFNSIIFKDNKDITTNLSGGNFGIGTTSPSRKLVVAQSNVTEPSGVDANTGILIKNNTWSGIQIISTEATGGFITFGDNAAGFAGRIQYLHATNAMVFETAASERMRITSGGEVQIGGKLTAGNAAISDYKYISYGTAGLNTTGVVVATVTGAGNGSSASIEFVGMGGVNGIVDVVYNCTNQGGNWYAYKNERQSPFGIDVVATGNGTTTLTFTFKAISSTQGYTPRVRMIGGPNALVNFPN